MKAYVVGGAVRDGLLGLPVHDRDWVVVGARPEQLIAQGYRPVGRDFPVFLHPQTHEEVALARTERKSGAGYHGFAFHAAPDVTLEQDLGRRDLTINAMALDPDTGLLIDPHGGERDLRAKILRHVSPAFAEDPVRLLRLARFSARWPDFDIAPETASLLQELVASGEVDALVPERVWQELARGMMERSPVRMFDVLAGCGALERLAPAIGAALPPAARSGLAASADAQRPLPERFALCCHVDVGSADTTGAERRVVAICDRWRVPNDCREMALLLAREHGALTDAAQGTPETMMVLFERCDAFRRPERFRGLLKAWQHLGLAAGALGIVDRLERALTAAGEVNAAALLKRVSPPLLDGPAIGRALHDARVRAIADAFART